jgi:DNA-binding transcriptional ArsR family regulator
MAKFSERNGYTKVPEKMVPESMEIALRNLLWNAIDVSINHHQLAEVTFYLWNDFYKKPVDERPSFSGFNGTSYSESWAVVRKAYFDSSWSGVYDHIEFFAHKNLIRADVFNKILAQEGAAYRIIKGQVCQITDDHEIKEMSEALELRGKFQPVTDHIRTALVCLSQRENPDYRNSIKESISAVESMAKILTGIDKATLGDALKKLKAGGKIDATLEKGFNSIYGWTCNNEGIRHALIDAPSISHADAKFYLTACSAFVNYLKVVGTI